MLSINKLRVEFGPRVLFKDLSFTVNAKERISFAGHNGAGKSTLMKCIAGVIEANDGELSKPRGCKIGYLPQEGIHIRGVTLWDETESAFGEVKAIQSTIDSLSDELIQLDSKSTKYLDTLDRIGELELKLEHFDPNKIKPRVESVLTGLGFKRSDFERDCSEFSGGWQMRIAMAKLFLQEPEVLLLDEPTNHLDIDSQTWMEQYLFAYPGAIIIISHDLALLDALTTRTIAFAHGRAEEYAGNYSFYLKESKLRKEILIKQYESQQKEIEKTKQFIDRFRAKASKASQAQSRLKQLEKMELIEIEQDDAVMQFTFPSPPPSTQMMAKLENASKSYGQRNIFEGFDLTVEKGTRMAIVGPNGAGKSTFCRLITGQEAPDSGHFELGPKSAISFFSQNHADELAPDRSVLETCEAAASRENAPLVRNILGCFLFRGDDVFKKVGVLSGGERSRVALVCMLVRPANFLILDEPTNHLDVQSQEVLQRALSDYPGSYLIVSHNRSFLDPIVTRTIEFRPDTSPQIYHGNISYYLDKKSEEANQDSATQHTKVENNTQKISRKEQRKIEAQKRQKRTQVLKPKQEAFVAVEASIGELEAAQATLLQHLSSPEVTADPIKMQETSQAYEKVNHKLENAYSQWSKLSEEIDELESQLATDS
ncbi:ABC-F family ATP-binding cassette domain-containing protein [Rubritalea marina]|uniref:ABC-F family ATP-binding cassette domain-containing protein n=1 Tax=Rubritalea marina TaxID=361055 RepID=UPI0003749F6D|nr:ABC-F family ATP-binding cassette domain-containing protein [Rubritalea marina]